jgi:hypothetical protein
MRSYYDHLKQVQQKPDPLKAKPNFRASAIFPVLKAEEISTRLIFLSYWILKRNISAVTLCTTLRDQKGQIIERRVEAIDTARTYRIELEELLKNSFLPAPTKFTGSIELEFYSSSSLIYPFPAVTVNYYGPHFSSFVHTAQRVYNDHEDMIANTQQCVPESGFNIHATKELEPFISLINGPEQEDHSVLKFQFINHKNDSVSYDLPLGNLLPYETRFVYPAREFPELEDFLEGNPGTVKVQFKLKWIFPRLLVGNIKKSPHHLSITHSYYDCQKAQTNSDYWIEHDESAYSAALMVPINLMQGHNTILYFYPIYSPSNFNIDLEIYDHMGRKLGEKRDFVQITFDEAKYISFNIRDICKELNISTDQPLGVRLMAYHKNKERIPARIKIALDIGKIGSQALPCNICTNLIPFNPELVDKPTTFHWMPLLADQPHYSVWIMNSSPMKKFIQPTTVQLTFYRENDTQVLQKNLSLPPNGFYAITEDNDPELSEFLNGKIGWVTITASNPYISTYYFTENPSGAIGGDHGY